MQNLIFQPFQADAEISIAGMKKRFEQLGVKAQKALLLARYLVEPADSAEVLFSDELVATQKTVLD